MVCSKTIDCKYLYILLISWVWTLNMLTEVSEVWRHVCESCVETQYRFCSLLEMLYLKHTRGFLYFVSPQSFGLMTAFY